MKGYNVALVGASGAVGLEIITLLEQWDFPLKSFKPLASKRSAGAKLSLMGQEYAILPTTHESFEGIDIAFFSAGSGVSKLFAPSAAKAGALVIDNTSFFRLEKDIPLVVPEVNAQDLKDCPKNIIANPNCSTIQMVQVLEPLHQAFGIERVCVSTYQAASGAGKRGIEELQAQIAGSQCSQVFPHPLALNVIPQIDVFMPSGYTKEEMKMVQETHKIMHADFPISATCVRVPVLRSHSESISIHFKQAIDAYQAQEVLKSAPNIVLLDDPSKNLYPMPINASHTDQTFVGRVRSDLFDSKILHLWCVADQLRVGAASNAVKIALEWIKNHR
ncbi:aspartate-semialdehyde dehydrogenase [Helicobacter felis]|uniref:Aspartate-semialdehyde dehydrogenase n=1 Tax=Helicobacter felis (strain ATCC 49179 / CCUG 28539 / NCTC 12436 / CS1) TaxID=936155 RepID=E7AA81_HELFC|nr:aspartate-semialdehyde dehydrogenase [Helicobacter felis]CBY82653.1 aspartate-semialdehyde dehydrogenase [Helicobacter felis ATCC 49179]